MAVVVPSGASVGEVGEWLAERCAGWDRGMADWLLALAGWDAAQGWRLDGQLSAVDWLGWRAGMARATAYDRVRVAHQLRRRRHLADALRSGRASWCAVRAITRAEGASVEVDEALVDLAEAGTVRDVERAVRAWQLHADQDRPPAEPSAERGLRLVPRGDGLTRVEGLVTDVEAAELRVALLSGVAGEEPVDPSSCGDTRSWPAKLADALVALVRGGSGRHGGADRYLVHVVVRDGEAEVLGGDAIDGAELARIRCDASTVEHHVGPGGAPLWLGRRRRTWTAAQHRAVTVRDGGRCRWPGCGRTRTDVHHVLAWEDGGRTDVDNGLLLCDQHHTLLHRGWSATGDAGGEITFHRPDAWATPVGSTRPYGTSTTLPRP